jgi:hypothetical protein
VSDDEDEDADAFGLYDAYDTHDMREWEGENPQGYTIGKQAEQEWEKDPEEEDDEDWLMEGGDHHDAEGGSCDVNIHGEASLLETQEIGAGAPRARPGAATAVEEDPVVVGMVDDRLATLARLVGPTAEPPPMAFASANAKETLSEKLSRLERLTTQLHATLEHREREEASALRPAGVIRSQRETRGDRRENTHGGGEVLELLLREESAAVVRERERAGMDRAAAEAAEAVATMAVTARGRAEREQRAHASIEAEAKEAFDRRRQGEDAAVAERQRRSAAAVARGIERQGEARRQAEDASAELGAVAVAVDSVERVQNNRESTAKTAVRTAVTDHASMARVRLNTAATTRSAHASTLDLARARPNISVVGGGGGGRTQRWEAEAARHDAVSAAAREASERDAASAAADRAEAAGAAARARTGAGTADTPGGIDISGVGGLGFRAHRAGVEYSTRPAKATRTQTAASRRRLAIPAAPSAALYSSSASTPALGGGGSSGGGVGGSSNAGWVSRAMIPSPAGVPFRSSRLAMRAALREARLDQAKRAAVRERIDVTNAPRPSDSDNAVSPEYPPEYADGTLHTALRGVGDGALGMDAMVGLEEVVEDDEEGEIDDEFDAMAAEVMGVRRVGGGGGSGESGERVRRHDRSRSAQRIGSAPLIDAAAHRPASASAAARDSYFAAAAAAVSWPGEELDAYDVPYVLSSLVGAHRDYDSFCHHLDRDDDEDNDSNNGESGDNDGWHPPHMNPSPGPSRVAAAAPLEEPGAVAVAASVAITVSAALYQQRQSRGQQRGVQSFHRPRTAPPARPGLVHANGNGGSHGGGVHGNGHHVHLHRDRHGGWKGKGVTGGTEESKVTAWGGGGTNDSRVGSGHGSGPAPLSSLELLPDEILAMMLARLGWRALAAAEASSPELRRVVVERRVWAAAVSNAAICAAEAVAGGLVSDTAGPQARNLQLHSSALLKRLSRRLSRPPHSAPPLCPNLAAEALCASSTDNAEEKVEHVLVPRVRGGTHKRPSYWSSAGAASPGAVDYVVLRLTVPVVGAGPPPTTPNPSLTSLVSACPPKILWKAKAQRVHDAQLSYTKSTGVWCRV